MSETFVWTDPDGTDTTLIVERQTQGRFAPPTRFKTDTSPIQPGSLMRNARHESRRVVIPILIRSDSAANLRTTLRELNFALDPVRGRGTLKVTGPGGTERIARAYLEDGMGLDESLDSTTGNTWQRASLQFFCEEPYWLDANTISSSVDYGTTTATFFPFFPLRLSSSSVFGSVEIDNTGDVNTWPQWTITGPGSAIYLKNLTTGKTINIDTTLTAGETITIDTTPGVRTITKNDGTSLFGSLTAGSELWPLIRGINSIQLEMSDAISGSSISYSYSRRWLSA
jgi:phage-related protein